MKTVLVVVAAVVGLLVLAMLIGTLLPRDHVATVRARYAASPAAIWALIADPATAPSWRPGLKSVEFLSPVDGRPAWRERSRSDSVNYLITEWDPPRRLVSRITSDNLPWGGQWEYSLVPSGPGTELSITERGFVNPALFRFLSRFVFGHTSTMEKYHRALGTKLGEAVGPEVVSASP